MNNNQRFLFRNLQHVSKTPSVNTVIFLGSRGWSLFSGLQMETNYIQSHMSGLEFSFTKISKQQVRIATRSFRKMQLLIVT